MLSRADFIYQVAEQLECAGYEFAHGSVLIERRWWNRFIPGFLHSDETVPYLVVESDNIKIGIDIYPNTILISPIFRAYEVGTKFNIRMMICVPDDKVLDIPLSVIDMARDNNIKLCSPSDIKETLQLMLNSDVTTT